MGAAKSCIALAIYPVVVEKFAFTFNFCYKISNQE